MRTDCKKFESCNAPLCPLLPDTELSNLNWVSSEDICNIREYAKKHPWIKRQKLIQRKADPENPNEIKGELRLYTVDELSKKKKKRIMTDEQKEKLKTALNKHREGKKQANL
jgi:hypothetical protein